MNQAKFGPIIQIGTVVDDLDGSIAHWVERMGVGPWTVFRNVTMQGRYRGKPTEVKMDVGLGYRGDLQIELIHVTNDARSPYLLPSGKPRAGLHHLAWITDDLETSVASATADGMTLVFEAENPTTRVAYLEAPGAAGILFEFIEGAGTRQLIADGIAAARAWDGTRPVEVIDFEA